MPVSPALSSYLDLVRFLAAVAVLLGHMDQDGLSMSVMPLARFSHEAVVIFFVLSGFIIYHSTASRASNWRQYTVARLSRIYSVALPAVVLSFGLAVWLSNQPDFDPSKHSNYSAPALWDLISSLLFLNESWLNPADVPLNNPYWSLCYEVWYYVIFGVFFFVRGRRRWLLVAAAAVIAGPAILVLFPVWLMGAWLAACGRHGKRWNGVHPVLALMAFSLPVLLMILINITQIDRAIQSFLYQTLPGVWRLGSSQRWVTDYLIGASLCLHISAFASLPYNIQMFFLRFKSAFAILAGFSFTLYLFHRPMTQLVGAWWPQGPENGLLSAALALGILLACWGISWGTEKQLPRWRRGVSQLFALRP